jgi:hypothetical protein
MIKECEGNSLLFLIKKNKKFAIGQLDPKGIGMR